MKNSFIDQFDENIIKLDIQQIADKIDINKCVGKNILRDIFNFVTERNEGLSTKFENLITALAKQSNSKGDLLSWLEKKSLKESVEITKSVKNQLEESSLLHLETINNLNQYLDSFSEMINKKQEISIKDKDKTLQSFVNRSLSKEYKSNNLSNYVKLVTKNKEDQQFNR